MNKKIITIVALIVLAVGVHGQTLSDVQSIGEPLQLPGTVCGMSVVDDEIYCFTQELPLLVSESHGLLSKVEPERIVDRKGVTYATRNPESDELYYTHKSWLTKSRLYVLPYGKNGKGKALKPGGGDIAIEHPAISENGDYMVFSSKASSGKGGKDLYITINTGQGWSKPEPITAANSAGNETSPSLWHNYLLFSSDGHNNSCGG